MNNKPLRFAHRGLVQYAPENTLEAFDAAIKAGCEGIELDIRLSKDGIPVVFHDKSMNRLSDGVQPGNIADLTAEEITTTVIPFAGHLLPFAPPVPYSENEGSVATYTEEQLKKFREEDKRTTHIVTFAEFDRWFGEKNADITIEIEFCCPGLVAPMYEILKNSKNINKYIIFSGHQEIVQEMLDLFSEKGRPEGLRMGENIRRLTEESKAFIEKANLYEVGLNDFWFSEDDIDYLTKKGIKIFSNLGDYPEWWEFITSHNITAFKTNYAEAYTEWLKERE